MPLLYKISQINRTFKDGRTDTANGKWFGRAIHIGTLETSDIADVIQRNCSMKKSDVLAVLNELTEVVQDNLQNSYAVKLNGLGTFKLGISSSGSLTAEDYSVSANVRSIHVNFQPEVHVDVNGNRTVALTTGCKVAETPKNEN